MNPSTSTATTSSPVVDSILQAYEHAGAGRYADALTTIKTAKGADSKNIYIIALERQFTKLLSLPRNQAASKEQRAEIMESLPSLLERAIAAARQHAQSESAVMPSGSSKTAERDAKLATLKKQYFDHADEYVQKGEYEHALSEIRRVIILDPDNRVAKEYEQKIMQLATRQSQRGPASGVAKPPSGKAPSSKAPSGYAPPSSRQPYPGEGAYAAPAYETADEQMQPLPEMAKKKSGKTPVLLVALFGGLIVIGGGVYFYMNRTGNGRGPIADAGTQATQQQVAAPSSAATMSADQQPAPQQATPQEAVPAANDKNATPQKPQPSAQDKQAAKNSASTPGRETVQPTTKDRQNQQRQQQTPKQAEQTQQPPALAANTNKPAATPSSTTTAPAPAQPAPSTTAPQDNNGSAEPFVPVEKQPQIIKLEKPKLSSLALQSGMEAKVVVKVQIDSQGKPLQAVIVSSSNDVFNDAVIEAVMKSKFAPGMMTTGPVTSWLAIPFKFNKGR